MNDDDIPTLTDTVLPTLTSEIPAQNAVATEELRGELQTRLTDASYALMEKLLYNAIREMEVALLEDLTSRMREEIPLMIEEILNDQFTSSVTDTETKNPDKN